MKQTHTAVDLTISIPAYNEEINVSILAAEIAAAMATTDLSYEVIFVDDGSTDRTWDSICKLSGEEGFVRGIRFEKNSGQSAALEAGMQAARGKLIATMDADLQNDPADLPDLLQAMGNATGAIGYRARRKDNFVRRLSSRAGNGVRNWLTGDNVKDTGCSLKVFDASAVQQIPWFKGMHRFIPAMASLWISTVSTRSMQDKSVSNFIISNQAQWNRYSQEATGVWPR